MFNPGLWRVRSFSDVMPEMMHLQREMNFPMRRNKKQAAFTNCLGALKLRPIEALKRGPEDERSKHSP